MAAQILLLNNAQMESSSNRSPRKRLKNALIRTLAVSGIALVVLTIILVYNAIDLDRIDKLSQIVTLNFQHEQQQKHTVTSHIRLMTDNTVEDSDQKNTPIYEEESSLNLQHSKLSIKRYRSARDVYDPLDPIHTQHELDFTSLYDKVRSKREKFELKKLEREYIRCKKKASTNSSDCMEAFAKMYKIAKEMSDKIDKMVKIFKDSELILEQNVSSNSEDTDDVEAHNLNDTKVIESNFDDQTYAPIAEPTTIANGTIETTTVNTVKTTKEEKFKISWIIDGHDDDDNTPLEEKPKVTTLAPISNTNQMMNATNNDKANTEMKAKNISLEVATPENPDNFKISWILDGNDSVETSNSDTKNTTAQNATTDIESTIDRPDSISWVLDDKASEHLHTTHKSSVDTTQSIQDTSTSLLTDYTDETTTNDDTTVQTVITDIISENLNETTDSSTMTTDALTNETTDEFHAVTESVAELRKVKFDTIIDSSEEITLEGKKTVESESATMDTTETVFSPTLVMDKTVVVSNYSAVTVVYGGNCTTTPKPVTVPPKSARLDDYFNNKHVLDYPSSLENMLESFEQNVGLKSITTTPTTTTTTTTTTTPTPTTTTVLTITTTTTKDFYDLKTWEEVFQKQALLHHEQDDLVDTFDGMDKQEVKKLRPILNPANMDLVRDAQLMSLCEHVAKRLREKSSLLQSLNDSESSTSAPAAQFTSRGPAGFPVTGETMKATAQFMFNPNFGMPTIPICFYITPVSYRMANQMNMWVPPMYGIPGGYAGYGGIPMGIGAQNGVFFMPQSFGPTGGVFGQTSSTGTGGSQSNIQNVFPKTASSHKQKQQQHQHQQQHEQQQQQQQFFCTYMQNHDNANENQASTGIGSSLSGISFGNSNFKMRSTGQNSTTDIIYASYAGVPDQLGSQKEPFKCALPDQAGCYGGNECIKKDAWCDGFVDCSDGSDEAACRCTDRLPSTRICDGYADCPMQEDELGCFGCSDFTHSCYESPSEYLRFNKSTISMCYSRNEKCDGIKNCLNGRDEEECSMIVGDIANQMSHSVSVMEGFLYHNYRGEWYPVCKNAEKWARDACSMEDGHSNVPQLSFKAISLPGPFIEPSHVGQAHFPQFCQMRDAHDKLLDQAVHLKCAPAHCGLIKKKPAISFRHKRSREGGKLHSNIKNNRQKRLIAEDRIVGGSYSRPLEWPFVVAIYRNGKFHCGGTIYTERWIISAAHCAINYHKYYYEVHAGLLRRSSFSSSTQIHPVSHVIVHLDYDRRSMRNDLSLLRLVEPLKFNRWVKPICLPSMERSTTHYDSIRGPEEGTLCTVVGWGAIREKGPGSDSLREVVVPIRKKCTDKEDVEAENICAGDVGGGRDACQGDSGGPLFCRSVSNKEEWYLAGVVSHGNGCARPREFGVYTRVSLYLNWIEMATKQKFLPKLKPKQSCPGYTCVWGGKRCISESNRCDRTVNCLGGEDEVGCIYNFIPDAVGAARNVTVTTESDYYPEETVTPAFGSVNHNAAISADSGYYPEETVTPASGGIGQTVALTMESDYYSEDMKSPDSGTLDQNVVITTENGPLPAFGDVDHKAREPDRVESTSVRGFHTTATADVTAALNSEQLQTETNTSFMDITTTDNVATVETVLNGTIQTETPPDLSKKSRLPFDVVNLVTTTPKNQDSASTIRKHIVDDLSSLITTKGLTQLKTVRSTAWESATRHSLLSTTNTARNLTAFSLKTTESPNSLNDFASTLTPTLGPPKVPMKFFCKKMSQVIDISHRCDRILDCEDGTDEEGCHCRDYLKGSLSVLICDGKVDCEDLTDEEDCDYCKKDEYLCPLSKTCISARKRCDDTIDCAFKEDEQHCFSLTNGKVVFLDTDKRPVLNNFGIFSRNKHGVWRLVCSHENPFHSHDAKTATDACSLLGFKGYTFYNTTKINRHDMMPIPPIHPDISKHARLNSHFSATVGDNHDMSSMERKFQKGESNLDRRIQSIQRVRDTCLALYVECEPKSNTMEPLTTVSAGEQFTPNKLKPLQPILKIRGKPNVFAQPETAQIENKNRTNPDKDGGIIVNNKNMTLMVDNKLHDVLEDFHWSWVVDVYVDGKLWCVGALVDKYWVLVHESCYFGVRFSTNYVAVLLGGGKTKDKPHKSSHEQIRRVDCFEQVPNSDVFLYHLDKPIYFTHHVLPTYFPNLAEYKATADQECIALLHDDITGRIKSVHTLRDKTDKLCMHSEMSCYRLIERKPPSKVLNDFEVSHIDLASYSEETDLRAEIDEYEDETMPALSRYTTCTQFGQRKASSSSMAPIDQGMLVCRKLDSGWYPLSLFDYNNTDCNSFKDSFGVRTLEKVFDTLQKMIAKPSCSHFMAPPSCKTFRCALGKCLDETQLCNGQSDCHDDADEDKQICFDNQKVCHASEMKCHSTFKCVPKTKFCDHKPDCADLTDEPTVCSCYTYLRATDPAKICDGVRNCWDKSDERPALCNCTADHFSCGTPTQECVPRDFVCDKELDCPNGEDEKYCFGLEYPQYRTADGRPVENANNFNTRKAHSQFGQVIEQMYGVWHTKCFPRDSPPSVNEVREICKKLGFNLYRHPSYRIIDAETNKVVESNESPEKRGRTGASKLIGHYREATKAVVVNKFSPLSVNNDLTLFLKPSRPIAEAVPWNATDASNCFRLEIKCM